MMLEKVGAVTTIPTVVEPKAPGGTLMLTFPPLTVVVKVCVVVDGVTLVERATVENPGAGGVGVGAGVGAPLAQAGTLVRARLPSAIATTPPIFTNLWPTVGKDLVRFASLFMIIPSGFVASPSILVMKISTN